VEADVGPSYATRRQEAFNALVQFMHGNNELMPVIGDLLFKNADFPGAEKIADALLAERARAEKRAGKTLSSATMDTLQAVLDLIAEADVALDSAQPLLAELMGVPNPDDDETEPDGDDATAGESQSNSAQVDAEQLARAARLARLRRESAA
jgi:hypothetical protein